MAEPFWDNPDSPIWDDQPLNTGNPWDTLIVGIEPLPGIAEVSTASSRKVDVKSGTGTNGGTTTLQGYNPAPVDIRIRVWTPGQWSKLQRMLASLTPKPSKGDPQAQDCTHPALGMLGIRSLIFVSVSSPAKGSAPQEMVVSIKAQEYFPPAKKSATKTPKSSEANIKVNGAVSYTPGSQATTQTQAGPVNYTPANGVQSLPSNADRSP